MKDKLKKMSNEEFFDFLKNQIDEEDTNNQILIDVLRLKIIKKLKEQYPMEFKEFRNNDLKYFVMNTNDKIIINMFKLFISLKEARKDNFDAWYRLEYCLT